MKLNFDEVSPITKRKCVLVEKETDGTVVKVCTESGYRTCSKWISGNKEFDLLGFKTEPKEPDWKVMLPAIRYDKEVIDPLLRRPTQVLLRAIHDTDGSSWLPEFLVTEKWCLHPMVRKDFVGHFFNWGISPIIVTNIGLPSVNNDLSILRKINDDLELGTHYDNPRYGCMSIVMDKEQVVYYFADYTKARWYHDYKNAYEAFTKLNNNG